MALSEVAWTPLATKDINNFEVRLPHHLARLDKSGKQLGDPVKAAKAILELVASENPPAHLLLGSDAVGLVRNKLKQMEAEIAAWERVSVSTDG